MPISAMSPETRIHSWSLVYFRSVGYAMLSPCLSFVERKLNDLRLRGAAADVDVDLCAQRGERDRDVRHAHRFLEERRLRTARDFTDCVPTTRDDVALTRDPALEHLEADERAREGLHRHEWWGRSR